jgi:LPS O-antigen subunit length determinant protein (WzzB/FepE family)
MTSMLGSYSAISNITGMNLLNESSTQSSEAIERMVSLEFFRDSVYPFINIEDLIAVKDWNAKDNRLIYDPKVYDAKKNSWIENSTFSKENKPSFQEAYKSFIDIFSVNEDIATGFVKVSISHVSPNIAKSWLDLIIQNINEKMRDVDKELALNAIDFLKIQLSKNQLTELNNAISKILESQVQILMMTSVNDGYVYKTISSPISPEVNSSPNRPLIIFLGTLISLFVSIFFVIAYFFLKKA